MCSAELQLGTGNCVYISKVGRKMRWALPGSTGHEIDSKIRRGAVLLRVTSFRTDQWSTGIRDVAWSGTRSCARCARERDLHWQGNSGRNCHPGSSERDLVGAERLL